MTNTQVTLVQIDNYGPWTVTPEPRREADLQTLQSRLYADISQFVGARGGYVFFTRFDNMVAVTNGLDTTDHELLQESIGNRYPVTLSLGLGVGSTPVLALEEATAVVQNAGSAQDETRREILGGDTVDDRDRTDADVQIAHFDVVDATGEYTDALNAYDSFIEIEQGYASLMRYMRTEYDSLSFFVGGDNIIAACPSLDRSEYVDAIEHVRSTVDVDLRVGVGRGACAQTAGMAAKHALERCRENGSLVDVGVEDAPVSHD
ncbi:GTP cyclohydrolase III [Halovivax gelatinilyticus]|uniref:GTP cyclohydrolase III n=1 Tax=Halovivax gelatinilyticus TaxID=2961597 RepID=UPI0020CA2EF4|nr:GTP cyclohydrolase III [Halovivax gelatinilyticus]